MANMYGYIRVSSADQNEARQADDAPPGGASLRDAAEHVLCQGGTPGNK